LSGLFWFARRTIRRDVAPMFAMPRAQARAAVEMLHDNVVHDDVFEANKTFAFAVRTDLLVRAVSARTRAPDNPIAHSR
jgi:hypothetical protein